MAARCIPSLNTHREVRLSVKMIDRALSALIDVIHGVFWEARLIWQGVWSQSDFINGTQLLH